MISRPQLSVLIPWYQRDEVARTLAANAPSFGALETEVLVLNCGGDSTRLSKLIRASEVAGVRQVDISAERFNKSLALNLGLERSRSNDVFILDADIILLDDCLREVCAFLDEGCFLTIEWVYESEPAAPDATQVLHDAVPRLTGNSILELRFRNGVRVRHQLSHRDGAGNRYASPGLLLARKHDLLEIQGYNSQLQAWGWEDDDVLIRLQHTRALRRVLKGKALHLTHGDDRRVVNGSRASSDQANFLKCCRNYNCGNFAGTYSTDTQWGAERVSERSPQTLVNELRLP
jgi:glycosyltransferase involved in cell wall biosynthesis